MKFLIFSFSMFLSTYVFSQGNGDEVTQYFQDRGYPAIENSIPPPNPNYNGDELFSNLPKVEPLTLQKPYNPSVKKTNQSANDKFPIDNHINEAQVDYYKKLLGNTESTDQRQRGYIDKNNNGSTYDEFADSFKNKRINTTEYVSIEESKRIKDNFDNIPEQPSARVKNDVLLISFLTLIIIVLLVYIFRSKFQKLLERFGIEIIYHR